MPPIPRQVPRGQGPAPLGTCSSKSKTPSQLASGLRRDEPSSCSRRVPHPPAPAGPPPALFPAAFLHLSAGTAAVRQRGPQLQPHVPKENLCCWRVTSVLPKCWPGLDAYGRAGL